MAGDNKTGFYGTLGVLALGVIWMLFAWGAQLRDGLAVTGLNDWGVQAGVPWGMYVVLFLWFDSIALGGMVVSTFIRLKEIRSYFGVARIAEIISMICMGMAGATLLFDLGRPDRIFNLIRYLPSRITESPLSLDFITVGIFLVLGLIYVMKNTKADGAGRGLTFVLFGWSLAMAGIVVPALFGVVYAQVGWFSTILGPLFLVSALTSGVAVTMLIAALYEGCNDTKMSGDIFAGLSKVLLTGIVLYGYMAFFQEVVLESILVGTYVSYHWLAIVLFSLTAIVLAVQWYSDKLSKATTLTHVLVPALVLVGFFVEKFLLVVPTFLNSPLPYYVGVYAPTWVEWAAVVGTICLAALLYMLVNKSCAVLPAKG